MSELPLEIIHVTKRFQTGFLNLRTATAVEDLSLSLRPNEIVGLLGPNGAGKTTTLKMVTGLIFPTSGDVRLFGLPVSRAEARRRMGFLPENPYFYDYLTAEEFLHMACGLADLPLSGRAGRVDRMLRKLGIHHARKLAMRKFSKGMLQRAGLAAALIHDPDLVVLDEPLSGLDPIGRRDFREIILELKRNGKTVLFSSHILPDVEDLCDRVAIIVKGRLREEGHLDSLLERGTRATDVEIRATAGAPSPETLLPADAKIECNSTLSGFRLSVPPSVDLQSILRRLLEAGHSVLSVRPHRVSLEDLFVTHALGAPSGPPAGADPDARDVHSAGEPDQNPKNGESTPGEPDRNPENSESTPDADSKHEGESP